MKLVINNQTHYRTCDLRPFFVRCAKQEGVTEARVDVVYNRQVRGCVTGYAYANRTYSRIMLPSQGIDRVDLAMVIAHEFAHNKGVTHKQMKDDPYYRSTPRTAEVYAWARELPIRKVEPKTKQRRGPTDKLAHAQAMLRSWETKLKKTKTLHKKWERRVKYYEKQIG